MLRRVSEAEGYNRSMTTIVDLANPAKLQEKEQKLFSILGSLGRVIVAYSGGTDSAYLAWAAHQVLGPGAVAITADSASIPESHKRDAEAVRRAASASPTNTSRPTSSTIRTTSRTIPTAVSTARTNCSRGWKRWGASARFQHIIYGVNVDDLGDYRPGQGAAKQHQVNAPLVDAGLTKAEIRELSRMAGLPTWDRPASACLSSRIPYGTPVTIQNVKTVEIGEEEIKALGFRQFRVRFHGEVVRIEIARKRWRRRSPWKWPASSRRSSRRWDSNTSRWTWKAIARAR